MIIMMNSKEGANKIFHALANGYSAIRDEKKSTMD